MTANWPAPPLELFSHPGLDKALNPPWRLFGKPVGPQVPDLDVWPKALTLERCGVIVPLSPAGAGAHQGPQYAGDDQPQGRPRTAEVKPPEGIILGLKVSLLDPGQVSGTVSHLRRPSAGSRGGRNPRQGSGANNWGIAKRNEKPQPLRKGRRPLQNPACPRGAGKGVSRFVVGIDSVVFSAQADFPAISLSGPI